MKIRTGDCNIVNEWVNNTWLEKNEEKKEAIEAVKEYIPDWKNVVKFRTATDSPQISNLEDSFQLVINYNCDKGCYIVWNAAVQKHIHAKKKYLLSIGTKGKDLLHKTILPTSITPFYRNVRPLREKQVELILIVGKNAIADFCKNYQEMIKPDSKQIPKGKRCLYAVTGGTIEYILSER